MKQKVSLALLSVLVLFGCSKSEEEAAAPVEEAAAPEPQKPKVGDMVLIPAGEFTMGSNRAKLSAPEHKVNLPAYYIDVYEVTFGQWMKFTTESDYVPESNWRIFYRVGLEDNPVPNLTLDDAKAFAKWAGKRLPTEAEWEKAARGPEALDYPWGDKWDYSKTNTFEQGRRGPVAVGSIEGDKSAYGVYDMMGNLQEWTSDPLKPYPGSTMAGDDLFKRGLYAVRGASYSLYANRGDGVYLWSRSSFLPKSQYGLGFRCAKDATEAPAKGAGLERPAKQVASLLPDLKRLALD